MPKYFLVILLFIIVVLFYIGIFYFDAYDTAPAFYDLLLHFLGGVWVAGAVTRYIKPVHNKFLLTMGLVALVGILWEFYEFLGSFLGLSVLDPASDILGDLFLNLAGGASFFLFYLRRLI